MIVFMRVVRAHAGCLPPARTGRPRTQTGSTGSMLRNRLRAGVRQPINDKEINMNKLYITTIAAAISLTFSVGALAAQAMSEGDYKAARDKISGHHAAGLCVADPVGENLVYSQVWRVKAATA